MTHPFTRYASHRMHAPGRFILTLGAFAGSIALACDRDAKPRGDVVTRDSAGVEVIDNPEAVSTLRLGSMFDESQAEMLADLELTRVTAALLLADGRVALTDDAARQLVLADPRTGARIRVGRRGSGPEEFQAFRAMSRCAGDTLVVRGLVGLQVFTAEGSFVRASSAPRIRGPVYGASPDCSSVMIGFSNIQSEDIPSDSLTLAWHDVARDSILPVVTVRTQARQLVPVLHERHPAIVPFAEAPMIAVAGDRLYVGRSGVPEIRVHDGRGRLVRIVRWTARPAPVTREDRDRYAAARLQLDERLGPGRTRQIPLIADFVLPDTKPVYSRIVADEEGWLLVLRTPEQWEGLSSGISPSLNENPEWWVFEPTGRLLGIVTAPTDLTIKDVRNGMIVGLQPDADDVPHLVIAPMRVMQNGGRR